MHPHTPAFAGVTKPPRQAAGVSDTPAACASSWRGEAELALKSANQDRLDNVLDAATEEIERRRAQGKEPPRIITGQGMDLVKLARPSRAA